uniref:CUB domain-containing protein n=1 Tax=Macrostomum lignano TaxID=282301 RepID=A0A1I8IQE5_9PLAT
DEDDGTAAGATAAATAAASLSVDNIDDSALLQFSTEGIDISSVSCSPNEVQQQQQQQQQNDPQHQIHFSSAYTADCFNMSTPIKPVTQCQQELPTTAAGPSYYLVAPEFVTTGGQFTCGGASQVHLLSISDPLGNTAGYLQYL